MRRSLLAAAALSAVLGWSCGAASAQSGVQAGVLECRGGPTLGLVLGSFTELNCLFKTDYGPPQPYRATIRRVGLDIGITASSVMAWVVFAPTRQIGPGDLAGKYAGAQASASVGAGVGANALIGGSGNSMALQPVSVQGQAGIGVAAGLAGLELRYAQ